MNIYQQRLTSRSTAIRSAAVFDPQRIHRLDATSTILHDSTTSIYPANPSPLPSSPTSLHPHGYPSNNARLLHHPTPPKSFSHTQKQHRLNLKGGFSVQKNADRTSFRRNCTHPSYGVDIGRIIKYRVRNILLRSSSEFVNVCEYNCHASKNS
jgi:hypothetical protein